MNQTLKSYLPFLSLLIACSAASSAATEAEPKPTADGSPEKGGPEAGTGLAPSSSDALQLGPNRIILVHAAANLGALRICFEGLGNSRPFPTDKFLPNSNQLGVDVGSATFLTLSKTDRNALLATAGATLNAFVIETSELVGARDSVSCRELESSANLKNGKTFWKLKLDASILSDGPHVLAVTGCTNGGLAINFPVAPECKTSVQKDDSGPVTGSLALLSIPIFGNGEPATTGLAPKPSTLLPKTLHPKSS
jgi:hypothetical protein